MARLPLGIQGDVVGAALDVDERVVRFVHLREVGKDDVVHKERGRLKHQEK